MTYKEMEREVIANRIELCKTDDLPRKRVLIARNHSLMVEMNSRWEK